MKRLILLPMAMLLICFSAMPQVVGGYFDKLADMYENEEWEDCAKRAEKLLNRNKYSGDPELYLYQAMAYYQISKDADLSELRQYRNAYTDALKHLVRAYKKDKYGEYFPQNNFIIEDFIKTGVPKLIEYSENEQYNKSSSLLRSFLRLSEDPGVKFYNAVMDLFSFNKRDALETMDTMLPEFDSIKRATSENTKPLLPDGMKHYFDLLIDEYELDSAKNIIKIAHKQFPNDTAIDRRYQMNLDSLKYE